MIVLFWIVLLVVVCSFVGGLLYGLYYYKCGLKMLCSIALLIAGINMLSSMNEADSERARREVEHMLHYPEGSLGDKAK